MSIQPRKQRKARYQAPLHVRRKQVASHLSEELLLRYNRRSMPVVTGDEVKIVRGKKDWRGKTGTVVDVDVKHRKITVEGITHKKADGTDVPFPLDPSNVLLIRLDLSDTRRRAKLAEKADAATIEKDAAAAAKAAEEEAKAREEAAKALAAAAAADRAEEADEPAEAEGGEEE